ncbi:MULTISPECIES: hypothetical protein [unclassified Sphingomonas]|uniref:hypothetical protein n=1 Tax=unclassified Sphingomonas TaxID=196159 RepID=UPI0006FD6BAA|nr:hypothetical protein [Sphingomonas sp. Leaf10]KQM36057.1 hypothetical protein ASE59_15430 [Sphingomonas sp. Leaf10]
MPSPDEVRATLVALAEDRGDSLSSLSRLIGRNAAYLHQFVTRGTPARLDEADRLVLAKHFRVDERRLGAREPWTPAEAAE